jgi:hypothetical protein
MTAFFVDAIPTRPIYAATLTFWSKSASPHRVRMAPKDLAFKGNSRNLAWTDLITSVIEQK